jgi:anti-sigma B factor antagonist
MEITEARNNEILIIGINGRLDTTNYGILENKLMSLMDAGQLRIIMDCSKMDYISSSGLRVFLLALKKATLMKGRFILADLQETIREIFEIAGFTSIFEIYKTREEALSVISEEVRK